MKALETSVNDADLDALAFESGRVPRGCAVGGYAFADDCPLGRFGRDYGAYADDAFLGRCFRQQGYGDVCFDVVCADIARGCAALFEVIPYILGVAFSYVEGYGDGFLAVYGRIGGCGLRAELPGLYLLHDPVKIGVHVGISGWVELAFNGREVLHAIPITRPLRRLRRRRVGRLRLYHRIAACH